MNPSSNDHGPETILIVEAVSTSKPSIIPVVLVGRVRDVLKKDVLEQGTNHLRHARVRRPTAMIDSKNKIKSSHSRELIDIGLRVLSALRERHNPEAGDVTLLRSHAYPEESVLNIEHLACEIIKREIVASRLFSRRPLCELDR
jgi:hypothetical protein